MFISQPLCRCAQSLRETPGTKRLPAWMQEQQMVQQSIIQRLAETNEKQGRAISKLKKGKRALVQRVEDAEKTACALVADRLKKECLDTEQLRDELARITDQRDSLQRERRNLHEAKTELQDKLGRLEKAHENLEKDLEHHKKKLQVIYVLYA